GRQEQDERQTEIPPHGGDGDADQRPPGGGQPRNVLDSEEGQIVVDQAELSIEQPHPDEADDGGRNDGRSEEQRARQTRQRIALIDEQGKEQPEHGNARHDDQAIEQDVLEGDRDPFVIEGAPVVPQPLPARAADDAPAGERDIDAEQNRQDVEDKERNREEGDQNIARLVDGATFRSEICGFRQGN